LGHARGAAIVTCRAHGVPVYEYSAREIKAAATGYGAAPKEQVEGMVCRLLGIREAIPPDASDALAMAFCRAVTRNFSR
jgi:crossover junction endodeoxyribonuclease RuvC